MATVNISPNMLLPVPIPTQDPGPDWANNLYSCLYSQIDTHDHSNGKGVQVTPAGINVNVDLPFNGNSATTLLSSKYNSQPSALDGTLFPASVYVAGGDLWYNSLAGAQVQVTSGSAVNVTSSGISSGTATASFISGVLVVNAAALTPANIQGGSLLLGNNVANSKYLTLAPPNAMAANYELVLPPLPASSSFVTLDTSGNFGTITQTGGITGSNIATSTITDSNIVPGTITGASIAPATITAGNIANGTITNVKLANPPLQQSGLISFSTTSSSPVDVTNSIVSIATPSNGKYIKLYLNGTSLAAPCGIGLLNSTGGNSNTFGFIRLLKSTDGGVTYTTVVTLQVFLFMFSGTTVYSSPSCMSFLDTSMPAAGTYFYKLQLNQASASTTISILACNLIAEVL